ncbi:ABC transporter permease subunit [Oscillospiraceae bacterium HV4-5-C5C]|nr:ABC transporter permease subunit [Oscillospiraceae bacterium HV4-5-C5C]
MRSDGTLAAISQQWFGADYTGTATWSTAEAEDPSETGESAAEKETADAEPDAGSLFDLSYLLQSFPEILKYAPVTLFIAVGSMLLGLVIGLLTALIKLYRIPVLKWLAAVYVSFTRGTPLLVQMYLSYYGIPKVLLFMNERYAWQADVSQIPAIVFVYVSFSLNVGAYLSETIRAAIQAVDRGQLEAAYSVGMSRRQGLWRIVFPQALIIALPNFGNTFIGLLKDTSLAFIIAVVDIMGQAKIIGARSLRFFEVYIDSAFIYWGICLLSERCLLLLERRVSRYLPTAAV